MCYKAFLGFVEDVVGHHVSDKAAKVEHWDIDFVSEVLVRD